MTTVGSTDMSDGQDDGTSVGRPPDDETTIVPDLPPTQAAEPVAWSTADTEQIEDSHKPLPRSLKVLLGVVVVAALALAAFVVGQQRSAQQLPAKPSLSPSPLPPTGPDGTYRIDYDSSQATVSGKSVLQNKPGESTTSSTWWAFRSNCVGYSCKVVGVRRKDADRQTPIGDVDTLVYSSGRWEDQTPAITPVDCTNGTTGTQSILRSWWFAPLGPDSVLRGTLTYKAVTDGCAVYGGDQMQQPFVGTRVGPIPPGVLPQ